MLISAHDASNINYSKAGTGWQLGWSAQKLLVTGQVTATGGTYAIVSPEVTKKAARNKKSSV